MSVEGDLFRVTVKGSRESIKQVSFDAFDGCPCEDEFDCEFEDDEYVQCISMAEGRARAMEKVVRELEALLKKIDY